MKIKKIKVKFPAGSSGIRIRNSDPQLEKMLDLDSDSQLINANPQPCLTLQTIPKTLKNVKIEIHTGSVTDP
jgi:hypothetical protein